MDIRLKQQRLQDARAAWDDDQPFQAGRTIFETIPVNLRPVWAFELVRLVYPYFPRDCRIEAVLEFAGRPTDWGYGPDGNYQVAHRIVDAVNQSQHDPLIVRLAAQAGKIVYTAQQYPAPFDHFAGWKIATVLWQIVRQVRDAELAARAWATLANEEVMLLDEPVMCHPACPTCAANGLAPIRSPRRKALVQDIAIKDRRD